jgi:hypothetical protein
MKKFTQLPALFTAAILLCLYAPAGAQPITTSMQVPLFGTVDVPLTNGSFDSVDLSGVVHVVTHGATPTDPMRIHVNLDQVTGVGDLTGFRYIATGADQQDFPGTPGDPMLVSFDLRPLGAPPDPVLPGDPMRLDISFIFTFGIDSGVLLDVDIESMTVTVLFP